MKGVLKATLHCTTNVKFKIWDGHIKMASCKSCIHILAVREVGKKIPSDFSICSKKQFLPTKDTQMLGRFWILGKGSNAGNSRRVSKFATVRMRECGISYLSLVSSRHPWVLSVLFPQGF